MSSSPVGEIPVLISADLGNLEDALTKAAGVAQQGGALIGEALADGLKTADDAAVRAAVAARFDSLVFGVVTLDGRLAASSLVCGGRRPASLTTSRATCPCPSRRRSVSQSVVEWSRPRDVTSLCFAPR